MRIDNLNLVTTTFSTVPGPFLKSLRPGQTLQALLLGYNQQGKVELRIGDHQFTAEIIPARSQADKFNTEFPINKNLKLEVLSTQDKIILQILNKEQGHRARKPLIQQLLRKSLPRHSTPVMLLKSLNKIKQSHPTALKTYQKPVIKQLVKLISNLPDVKTITSGKGLKQAVDNSGLFMEPRLNTALSERIPFGRIQEIFSHDFKAMLLKTYQVIEQNISSHKQAGSSLETHITTGQSATQKNTQSGQLAFQIDDIPEMDELKQHLDSMLAKIQMNQAKAIITDKSQPPVWLIDIPIQGKHEASFAELQISYEHQGKHNDATDRKWTVTITFNLEHLGRIDARLTLFEEELTSYIWAENKLTGNLIEQSLNTLTQRMQEAGLSVNSINCCSGSTRTLNQEGPVSDSLLSIRI